MSTKQAKRWLAVAVVWLVISGALVALGKHYMDGENGNGDVDVPPPPPPPTEVFRVTIRFSPGTKSIMRFCEADIETLAEKLNADLQCRVRIIGHISPGSNPAEELQLTRDQVSEIRRRLWEKAVSQTQILSETSKDPDENGAYGVATCIVEKKRKKGREE